MITAFHTAFLAHFNAATSSDFYTALTGGLHLHTAPDGTAEPYAVFFLVSAVPSSTFTERMRDVLLQVNIFAPGRGQAMELADSCLALFHGAEVAPEDTLCIFRVEEGSIYGPTWADDTWQMSVELRCLIESQ